MLLLVAQWSFDPRDLGFNRVPPNDVTRNWIGPIGAGTAYGFFFFFGIAAYLVPDASIDPFMLSLEMMAQAEQFGTRLLRRTAVVGFERAGEI